MQPKTQAPLLTEAETANALGLRRQTLAVRRSTGKPLLPFIRVGRSIRYRSEDIAALIAANLEGGY